MTTTDDTRSTKHPEIAFVKIDVDANEEAASKSNIRTIPAFYFYRKGKLVGKVRPPSEIRYMAGVRVGCVTSCDSPCSPPNFIHTTPLSMNHNQLVGADQKKLVEQTEDLEATP